MSDRKTFVITGCVARNLRSVPSFSGKPNQIQKFELTLPVAQIMARRLKNKPLRTEHMKKVRVKQDGELENADDQPGAAEPVQEVNSAGMILHSWIDEKNDWYIQARLDDTLQGHELANMILSNKVGQLSLSHCPANLNPDEVSAVVRGQRDQCFIENIQLMSDDEVGHIISQEYKPTANISYSNQLGDSASNTSGGNDELYIRATFKFDNNTMATNNTPYPYGAQAEKTRAVDSTFLKVRKPAGRVQYDSTNADPSTSGDINQVLQTVDQQHRRVAERLGMPGNQTLLANGEQSQLTPRPRARPDYSPVTGSETTDAKVARLEQLMLRQQELLEAQHGPPKTVAQLANEMNDSLEEDTPYSTGRSHRLTTSAIDQGLPELMKLLHTKKQLMEGGEMKVTRDIVTGVAIETGALRDENEQLRAENARLKQSEQAHSRDKESTRAQASKILQKLIASKLKGKVDGNALAAGGQALSDGNTDEAWRILDSELVKASFQCDLEESQQSQQQEQQHQSPPQQQQQDGEVDDESMDRRYEDQVANLIRSSRRIQPLSHVQASYLTPSTTGSSSSASRKRPYNSMMMPTAAASVPSASSSSSSGAGRQWDMAQAASDMTMAGWSPSMAQLFQRNDNGDLTAADTTRKADLVESNKRAKFNASGGYGDRYQ